MRLSLDLGLGSIATLGGGVRYDADAAALFARFTTPPSSAEKARINNCIEALKAAGVWTKMGVLYVPGSAQDSQAAALDWKNAANLTLINAPSWNAQGFNSNGTTSYLDLAIPASSVPGLVQDSVHLGAWITAADGVTSFPIGRQNASGLHNLTTAPANLSARLSSATAITMATVVVNGYHIATRRGATASELYQNGTSLGTNAEVSTGLGSGNVHLLESNATFTPSAVKLRLAHLGSQLSAADVTALQSIFTAFFTAGGL
jgi:hypothetical protein